VTNEARFGLQTDLDKGWISKDFRPAVNQQTRRSTHNPRQDESPSTVDGPATKVPAPKPNCALLKGRKGSKKTSGVRVNEERCSRVRAKCGGGTRPANGKCKRVFDGLGLPDTRDNDEELPACKQSRHGERDRS
jgi:hypothetical protein